MRKYLEEQFEDRPRKWWQYKANDYIPTKDMDTGKTNYPHNPEETIVRFNFKRALISSALFFIVFLLFYFISANGKPIATSSWLMNIAIFIALFFPLIRRSKRGELVVFNKAGFRISTMPGLVPWHHLVASYIRKENSGEHPSYYLLMYYYDEKLDEFKEIELDTSGLDLSKENIASQIEYWKIITATNEVLL